MNPGLKWIVAVIGLLVANILAMTVLIGASHHDPSRVIDNYYDKAVHYDDRIDQEARNRELAWRVHVSLEHGVAIVTADDARGQPLLGARVRVDGVERAESARTLGGELIATRAGEYRGQLGGAGWIDLSVTIDRRGERYVRRLAVEAR